VFQGNRWSDSEAVLRDVMLSR